MKTLINQMIEKEKQTSYNFISRETGIAGICPDCNGTVSWNSYHSRFQCLNIDCCFEANEKGERVWDNNKREENLKNLKEEKTL